jgi:type IV pilus biogenesis protein CpaD/CtpE
MTLRPVLLILGLLATLALSGCADTGPSQRSFKPFAALMRSDDQTLTKEEQKAAITELQNDKKQQQQQAAEEGAVVPAKTAQ